ncbi:MAG: 1,4-beta-D-glucan glucohydrolase [Opitutia bacterium UBA7350]|nr:MAG: 1,4-beta-D-glucan glucohydrolase [Opitutae bacterium UBA7350]
MSFKKNFVWGAATASYQIEGAASKDGKGPNIWDAYCEIPGNIKDGNSGDIACDHYHRYKEDAALMSQIGLKAYRFSLSWSRILPEGTGTINSKGLDFYDNLVDALLEKGIAPYATLFHWDLPQALQLRGGWLNADIPEWFAEYTQIVAERLSDRIKYWFTLNEPQCFIGHGLLNGTKAPGLKLELSDVLLATHHSLLAHGRAVQAIRAADASAKIGAAPTGSVAFPKSETEADINAAYQATFSVPGEGDLNPGGKNAWLISDEATWNIAWYADPIFLGKYPEEGLAAFGDKVPRYTDADMAIISQPLDFCGINLYSGWQVEASTEGNRWEEVPMPQGDRLTAFKWPVTPEILYWGSRFFYERYNKPIYITENGMSAHDWVDLDGAVRDHQRIDFVRRYLREFRRAAGEGIPVEGYFLWSLMDNFEWAEGYRERFGIIHVDYETQERRLKESAKWYATVIAENGENL